DCSETPARPLQNNNTCVDVCPDDDQFPHEKMCVTECPDPLLLDDKGDAVAANNTCEPECPQARPVVLNGKSCTNTCPDETPFFNQLTNSCVTMEKCEDAGLYADETVMPAICRLATGPSECTKVKVPIFSMETGRCIDRLGCRDSGLHYDTDQSPPICRAPTGKEDCDPSIAENEDEDYGVYNPHHEDEFGVGPRCEPFYRPEDIARVCGGPGTGVILDTPGNRECLSIADCEFIGGREDSQRAYLSENLCESKGIPSPGGRPTVEGCMALGLLFKHDFQNRPSCVTEEECRASEDAFGVLPFHVKPNFCSVLPPASVSGASALLNALLYNPDEESAANAPEGKLGFWEGETAANKNFSFSLSKTAARAEYRANLHISDNFTLRSRAGYTRENSGAQTAYYHARADRALTPRAGIYAEYAYGQTHSRLVEDAPLEGFSAGLTARRLLHSGDSYSIGIDSPLARKRAQNAELSAAAFISSAQTAFGLTIIRRLQKRKTSAVITYRRQLK
ncbi:MAG: hypothetical protein ACR2P5_06560, partial [Gammaproteobacteria bacterium]